MSCSESENEGEVRTGTTGGKGSLSEQPVWRDEDDEEIRSVGHWVWCTSNTTLALVLHHAVLPVLVDWVWIRT